MTTEKTTVNTGTVQDGVYVAKVSVRKKFLERLKTRVKDITVNQLTLKLWANQMHLNMCFVAQGFIGIITLCFFQPWLTGTASRRVAVLKGEINSLNEKKKQQELEEQERINKEKKDNEEITADDFKAALMKKRTVKDTFGNEMVEVK